MYTSRSTLQSPTQQQILRALSLPPTSLDMEHNSHRLSQGSCTGRLQTHGCFRQTLKAPQSRLSYERNVRIRARDDEYFDEGAAQVRRLLDRDRKEVMKDQEEPKAEYDVTFDKPSSSSNRPEHRDGSNGASSSESKAYEEELSNLKNPMKKAFKSPPKKGAFGSSAKSPFGSDSANVVQKDMWANMEPVEMDEAPWWTQISFGQVAIVLSFVLIIGLMLATTWATVKLGGVHFNE